MRAPELLAVAAAHGALSVREFAAVHSLSAAKVYQLIAAGRGPEVVRVDGRRLVTAEAAKRWRDQLPAARSEVA